jgi:hypothetical protein
MFGSYDGQDIFLNKTHQNGQCCEYSTDCDGCTRSERDVGGDGRASHGEEYICCNRRGHP